MEEFLKNRLFWSLVIDAAITVGLIKLVYFIFHRAEKRLPGKGNKNLLVYKYMSRVVAILIAVIMFFFFVYQVSGNDKYISTILASSGIATVVLGLAAQESLGNVISGFFVMVFRPFVIGDRVVLKNSGITGYIEDISLRHTIIRTYYNSRYIIPNSKMNSEIIENSNLIDPRAGMFLDVTVNVESDIPKAVSIMKEVIEQNPAILDLRTNEEIARDVEKISILVREINIYGVSLRSTVWTATVDDSFTVLSDLRMELIRRFQEENIKIAVIQFPSIDSGQSQKNGIN